MRANIIAGALARMSHACTLVLKISRPPPSFYPYALGKTETPGLLAFTTILAEQEKVNVYHLEVNPYTVLTLIFLFFVVLRRSFSSFFVVLFVVLRRATNNESRWEFVSFF